MAMFVMCCLCLYFTGTSNLLPYTFFKASLTQKSFVWKYSNLTRHASITMTQCYRRDIFLSLSCFITQSPPMTPKKSLFWQSHNCMGGDCPPPDSILTMEKYIQIWTYVLSYPRVGSHWDK